MMEVLLLVCCQRLSQRSRSRLAGRRDAPGARLVRPYTALRARIAVPAAGSTRILADRLVSQPDRAAARNSATGAEEPVNERLAIVGSGAIACGLAATAAHHGPVLLLARSESSADRARRDRREDPQRAWAPRSIPSTCRSSPTCSALAHATFVVEAVVEDHDVKAGAAGRAERDPRPRGDPRLDHLLALGGSGSRRPAGRPERFLGLHVFNPVTKMKLVELVFPARGQRGDAQRARSRCARRFEKTPVEVPDVPGFVVNRLLFPYLFSAVRLLEETGMDPADVDTCMKLGAGHPMGPLALLDLVGPRRLRGDRRDDRRGGAAARGTAGRARARLDARPGAGSTATEIQPWLYLGSPRSFRWASSRVWILVIAT